MTEYMPRDEKPTQPPGPEDHTAALVLQLYANEQKSAETRRREWLKEYGWMLGTEVE
jgi:hypothetical protein